MEHFSELPDRSNSDNSLGLGLLGTFKLILLTPMKARLLGLPDPRVVLLLVFKATMGMDQGKLKCHNTGVLTKIQPLFFNKHS